MAWPASSTVLMSVRSEKSLTTSRKVASISSYRPSSRSMGGDGGVSGSGCQRFEPAREGVRGGSVQVQGRRWGSEEGAPGGQTEGSRKLGMKKEQRF